MGCPSPGFPCCVVSPLALSPSTAHGQRCGDEMGFLVNFLHKFEVFSFLLRELVLGSDVIRPDDDAFHRSVVQHDLGVEALGEGEPKCHQPDYPYDDSGASGREPGLEGVNYCHVPAGKTGNAFTVALVNYTTNTASVGNSLGWYSGLYL